MFSHGNQMTPNIQIRLKKKKFLKYALVAVYYSHTQK